LVEPFSFNLLGRSLLYLRALANAGAASAITQVGQYLCLFFSILKRHHPTDETQLHCEELFEPARVLAVKLTKVCIVIL
jgi:hypothetical protein